MVECGIQPALIQWLGIVIVFVLHIVVFWNPYPGLMRWRWGLSSETRVSGKSGGWTEILGAGSHVYRHPRDVGDHLR